MYGRETDRHLPEDRRRRNQCARGWRYDRGTRHAGLCGRNEGGFFLVGEGHTEIPSIAFQKIRRVAGMKPGVHESSNEWAESMLARTFPYFIGERIYSHVALAYVAVFDRPYALDFLSRLKSHAPIFVGNREIRPEVLGALFGLGPRIPSPPRYAYAEVDRVTRETESALDCCGDSYEVVAMAIGCAGRVVAKRIL